MPECCAWNPEMMRPISFSRRPSWEKQERKCCAAVSCKREPVHKHHPPPFIRCIWQTHRERFPSVVHRHEMNGKFHSQARLCCWSSRLPQVCYSLPLGNKRCICYMSQGSRNSAVCIFDLPVWLFKKGRTHNRTLKFQAAIEIYGQLPNCNTIIGSIYAVPGKQTVYRELKINTTNGNAKTLKYRRLKK